MNLKSSLDIGTFGWTEETPFKTRKDQISYTRWMSNTCIEMFVKGLVPIRLVLSRISDTETVNQHHFS